MGGAKSLGNNGESNGEKWTMRWKSQVRQGYSGSGRSSRGGGSSVSVAAATAAETLNP